MQYIVLLFINIFLLHNKKLRKIQEGRSDVVKYFFLKFGKIFDY